MYFVLFKFSSNNIFVTVSDKNKKTIKVLSTKRLGFSGSRKTSNTAINQLLQVLVDLLKNKKINNYVLSISGYNKFLKLILQFLFKNSLTPSSLINTTPIPHNGCRSPVIPRK